MMRLLYLAETYPDFQRISTSKKFIRSNINIIESNIHEYFKSSNEQHDLLKRHSMSIGFGIRKKIYNVLLCFFTFT